MKVESYKFSDAPGAPDVAPDILGDQTPQEFLKSKYQKGCFFGIDNLKGDGCYRIMGWRYDFRPFMKKILIKTNGQWEEIWGPNKTAARAATYGRIQGICELS